MVRIMIADDHILFRQIIREVLEKENDLEVIAEAADGGEVIVRAAETQPDVVLMDLTMPLRCPVRLFSCVCSLTTVNACWRRFGQDLI